MHKNLFEVFLAILGVLFGVLVVQGQREPPNGDIAPVDVPVNEDDYATLPVDQPEDRDWPVDEPLKEDDVFYTSYDVYVYEEKAGH